MSNAVQNNNVAQALPSREEEPFNHNKYVYELGKKTYYIALGLICSGGLANLCNRYTIQSATIEILSGYGLATGMAMGFVILPVFMTLKKD